MSARQNVVHLHPGQTSVTAVSPMDQPLLDGGSGPPHPPGMDEARLAKLESTFEGFKAVPSLAFTVAPIAMGALALAITIGIFTINNMSARIDGLSSRVDGLSNRVEGLNARFDGVSRQITDEFRAMRVETAAQTSAIASSITAARQIQPQIVVMPPVQLPTPPAPALPQAIHPAS